MASSWVPVYHGDEVEQCAICGARLKRGYLLAGRDEDGVWLPDAPLPAGPTCAHNLMFRWKEADAPTDREQRLTTAQTRRMKAAVDAELERAWLPIYHRALRRANLNNPKLPWWESPWLSRDAAWWNARLHEQGIDQPLYLTERALQAMLLKAEEHRAHAERQARRSP